MKQAEIVARDLTNQIVVEDLPEGTKLANEREMLETYQVGRSTLREALRLLESRGVLTIRSGRDGGPIVRRPRASDLGEALTLLMQFERVPFSEVFTARQALEPRVTRLAAEGIDDETLAALHDSNDKMAAHLDDRHLFREENRRFHELVASAAQSPVLEMFCAALESVAGGMAFGQVAAEFTHEQRATVLEAHRNILKALVERDPDAAEEAMRVHLEEGMANWKAAYHDLSAQPVQWSLLPPLGSR
ncbi:FadR/GntR family transcriptional regulator [Nocardioides sp. AN3]